MQSPGFAALVPVKSAKRGKSRLAPLGDDARESLVRAFSLDTVAALIEAPAVDLVMVVTDDVEVARSCRLLGAEAIPDAGDGLNGALVQAAAEVHRLHPELALMAVCADLAALDTPTIAELTEQFGAGPAAFVPDASGDGTTVYLSASYDEFAPRFGPGSARAHREGGAHVIDLTDDSPARADIDTPDDLERTRGRVGPHTRLALTCLGI